MGAALVLGAWACTKWLVYYINPRCIDGFCQWDEKALGCPLCDCMNGGCTMSLTAPSH